MSARVSLVLVMSASIAFACSTGYDGRLDTALPDAGADDASPESSVEDASADAAAEDATTVSDAECTPSKAPSCATLGSCEKRQLYTSPGGYPFAIATDLTFVYWVEQRAPGDAYNGSGVARIMRTTRTVAIGTGNAEVLASNQEKTIALTVTGGFVYWTTYTAPDGAPSATRVKRVPVGCAAPCTVQDVTGVSALEGIKIERLLPGANGTLYMLGTPGHVFHFTPNAGNSFLTNVGAYPAITATSNALYATGLTSSKVARVTYANAVTDQYATIPPHPQDGGNPGLLPIANDCTSLFGLRQPGNMLYEMPFATKVAQPVGGDSSFGFYDMAADAKWLYGGMPNTGGVFAIDKTTGTRTSIVDGNVFTIAVDDMGVYWSEHGGAGTVSMIVK